MSQLDLHTFLFLRNVNIYSQPLKRLIFSRFWELNKNLKSDTTDSRMKVHMETYTVNKVKREANEFVIAVILSVENGY